MSGDKIEREHVCIVPSGEAAACLDCGSVFSIRSRKCPSCGSEYVYLLQLYVSVTEAASRDVLTRFRGVKIMPVEGEVS